MFAKFLFAAAVLAAGTFCADEASAQATRTWVSGVGDDVNPCSRTAPCKTFAGAISKTADRGIINVLDPAGYGSVTITKSISIVAEGAFAGVLVVGTYGIIINAPSTAVVKLEGLSIEGNGNGLSGVKILAAGSVTIKDCEIFGFRGSPGTGVELAPTAGSARVTIIDSVIRDNLTGVGIKPVGGAVGRALLDRVRLLDNAQKAIISDGTTGTADVIVTATTIVNNGAAYASLGGGLVTSMGNNTVVRNAVNDPFDKTVNLR
jgi:hypothetical protein